MDILQFIAQTIFDKKGFNILTLDVRSCSTMTDYIVIAEGGADVHVKAIAEALLDSLEKMEHPVGFQQGLYEGDWVVLDAFAVIIHIFKPGLREKYSLEALWPKADIVDVAIAVQETVV